jgi:hypothetical protein
MFGLFRIPKVYELQVREKKDGHCDHVDCIHNREEWDDLILHARKSLLESQSSNSFGPWHCEGHVYTNLS